MTTIVWVTAFWVTPDPKALGIIPTFVDYYDERPVIDQINDAYAHGGGWRDAKGFVLVGFDYSDPFRTVLAYPGDPAYRLKAYTCLRGEYVLLFDHDWCVVTRDGQDFRCARLD